MADLQTLKGKITSTIYPNGTGAITAASHQALLLDMVDTIDEAIGQSKSDVRADGNYPNMSVGFSANLIGRGESIASEIGFRASGGKSIEDGSARITELQGNAVVWNNLVKWRGAGNEAKGITLSYNNGLLYVSGTPTESVVAFYSALYDDASITNLFTKGHYYAICGKSSHANVTIYGDVSTSGNNVVVRKTGDSMRLSIRVENLTVGESIKESFPILIVDLTKMFGSGNEPTTIDEFYNRMPQGINVGAYTEGQLISSNVDGIKSVGFNAWDEKWEVGQINVLNGEVQTSTNTIRSKNYCKCLPNETYYAYCGGYTNEYYLGIVWYDENYNYIGYNYGAGRTRQSPSNARYFKLTTNTSSQVNYGTTYNGDICINLVHSGYKNGTYQPYQEFIKTFDYRIKDAFPNGMMPWDKVYNKNGKGYVVKGTGVFEDLSKLNWKKNGSSSTGGVYYADHKGTIILDNISTQLVLSLGKYEISGNAYNYGTPTKNAICLAYGALYISDLDINDAEALKTYLQGVSLYYELATPTIVEYDEPFNLDYEVWDFGTEEMLTSEPSAPIKAMIRYQFNAVDEVRELRQMIATLQATIANL